MATKETISAEKATYEPVIIADNKEYINLSASTGEGFANNSKNMNDVNSTGSPSVVDYYGRKV